jgi:hypothetical protein
MSPVRYEQRFYISEDGTLDSHRRENFKFAQSQAYLGAYSRCRQNTTVSFSEFFVNKFLCTLHSWSALFPASLISIAGNLEPAGIVQLDKQA